jgi:hypothetical protein
LRPLNGITGIKNFILIGMLVDIGSLGYWITTKNKFKNQ